MLDNTCVGERRKCDLGSVGKQLMKEVALITVWRKSCLVKTIYCGKLFWAPGTEVFAEKERFTRRDGQKHP